MAKNLKLFNRVNFNVRLVGIEPTTPALGRRRSIHWATSAMYYIFRTSLIIFILFALYAYFVFGCMLYVVFYSGGDMGIRTPRLFHASNIVDRTGFEPVASSMPWKRSTNWANGPFFIWEYALPASTRCRSSTARRAKWATSPYITCLNLPL